MRKGLVSLRKQKEMSQEEIARAVGISRSAYALIESGKRNPSYKTVLEIKKILKTDEDGIFLNDS